MTLIWVNGSLGSLAEVADQDLGKAVLRLAVDDTAFKAGLKDAKKLVSDVTEQKSGAKGSRNQRNRIANIKAQNAQAARFLGIATRINAIESKGTNVDRLRLQYRTAAAQIAKKNPELLEKELGLTERLLKASEAKIATEQRAARQRQRAINEAQRLQRQAEREARQEQRRREQAEQRRSSGLRRRGDRRRDILSSALIGGGFPLLFGQGVGAAGGGAIGGLLGGLAGGQAGFALSIAGTALGTQVDASIRKVETLSKAFDSPIKSFQTLSQEGLISSRSLEKQIEALISTGRAAEASALIQKDLATTFEGFQAENIADTFDQLNRNFAQLSVTVGSFIAGPLNKFLEAVNKTLRPDPEKSLEEQRKEQSQLAGGFLTAGVGLAAIGLAGAATGGLGALPALGLVSSGGVLAGVSEGIVSGAPTDEQIAESKRKAIRAQEKQNQASQRFQRIQKLNRDLAVSDIQNTRKRSLELQKLIADLQEVQETQALSETATEPEKTAIKDRFDLERAQIKARQDLLAENESKERRQTASAIAGIKARGDAAEKIAVAEANGQKTLAITIQNRVKQEEKIRALKEAQIQLDAELAKPPQERDTSRIDALVQGVEAANANVLAAYQEGGAALVRNATTAAERLKGAQQSISNVLRGGFEFLSPQFREQELARARASIASGERRGLLRGGIDISTPERLFAVANFVESFNQAEDELQQAIRENTAAQQALAAKEPVNVFVSGQAAVSTSTVGAINRGS